MSLSASFFQALTESAASAKTKVPHFSKIGV